MTSTFTIGIETIMSVTASLLSCVLIMKLSTQSFQIVAHSYGNEFQAHRCGRTLAAMLNIEIEAAQIQTGDPQSDRGIARATDWLTGRLEQSLSNIVSASRDQCRLRNRPDRGARIYRYNRFHTKESTPNYTYRLDYFDMKDKSE